MCVLHCILSILLCIITLNYSFHFHRSLSSSNHQPIISPYFHVTKSFLPISSAVQFYQQQILSSSSLQLSPSDTIVSDSSIPPNFDDMKRLAYILANVTDHLDASPDIALSIASQEMGWLYSRDVPK